MSTAQPDRSIAPAGQPLELLFERANAAYFELPASLRSNYGGELGLPKQCLVANFVASVDGVVALPGDTESGQIISGRNAADRFVMGLLRACADAVLIGAGTFRKSAGHLWTADRIYPLAAAELAELRGQLGLTAPPQLVLISASGKLDTSEPAAQDAWIITTPKGEAALRSKLPAGARLTVVDSDRLSVRGVLATLRAEGFARVLTEGGPTLFAELVRERLVDELFVTSSPALFGRFPGDDRKSLCNGLDLNGAALELLSVRRHGSHLFQRYALSRV
ncbi:MAG TPA: dihydrofolate reductase family protein [Polyangiaceae bacterium]|jgi:riboflavin biosynthesis pyrimidine reductase|nr:dihydrofolate reductase family protein [Polyangiaceae bacterium]